MATVPGFTIAGQNGNPGLKTTSTITDASAISEPIAVHAVAVRFQNRSGGIGV